MAMLTGNIEDFSPLIVIYILTYRNNPPYISMVILIFLFVRSDTDQILMK